ncbi:ABC transporter ATP-binding protein [Mycoplasma marinum]|uniref:Peptide ABC transporter ATP-binding protein n=1 Tax=Mycoplasma marinum TaxID=1937190 RepID=A0A4R0XRL4_9MOLU|nr:ABC transporter ATP-binding protein [Mycoplasma marinum]TCG11050.1 peptide ABC transporter ATP-binding protein [Mycoplasma marinum]
MLKKNYIEFAEKQNFKISSSLSKSDYEYSLIVESKRKFNTETELQDIYFILDILKVNYNKNQAKKELLNLLKGQIINEEESVSNNISQLTDFKKTPKKETIVSVENLTVSFKNANNRKQNVNVIRGVTLKVSRGEIVGLIGESGSGKSVTAKTFIGMNVNSITKADSLIISNIQMVVPNTKKVYKRNSKWRNIRGRKVSYIPQNPMTSLNPTMKIYKQILEVMNLCDRYKRMNRKEKIKEIIELLEKFGISNSKERIKLYPHEFSGGMRQRVVIAMSVIARPDIIIADEPTTALDPTIQASVLSLFKIIAKEYNIAIIFVSHDISVISTLCDHVNVFYAGRIVETAPKYELFTNAKHPYTWALLSSMPQSNNGESELFTLDGSPPNFSSLPAGDPFSVRNKYALEADFKEEPPLIRVPGSIDHYAATWLLHPKSPKVKPPNQVDVIAKQVKEDFKNEKQ